MRNFISGLISFLLFAIISCLAGVGAAIVLQLLYSVNVIYGAVGTIITALALAVLIYKLAS